MPSPRRVQDPSKSYRDPGSLWEENAALGQRFFPVEGLGSAVRLLGLDHRRKRRNRLIVTAQPHHDHALRRAAEPLDVLDGDPDHGARRRDQHHLVAVANDTRADEMAAGLGQLHGLDSHAATALHRVLGDARALAIAVLGHDERSASSSAMLIEITSSPLRSFMPETPDVSRPIERTSVSWKRIACPFAETMRMSSSPEEWRTPTSSSPSRILIA